MRNLTWKRPEVKRQAKGRSITIGNKYIEEVQRGAGPKGVPWALRALLKHSLKCAYPNDALKLEADILSGLTAEVGLF